MTEKEFLEIINYWDKYIFTTGAIRDPVEIKFISFLKTFIKPKPEFNPGDRVAAYDGIIREIGTIVKVSEDPIKIPDDVLIVLLDNGYAGFYNKKQCRRLKKKEK